MVRHCGGFGGGLWGALQWSCCCCWRVFWHVLENPQHQGSWDPSTWKGQAEAPRGQFVWVDTLPTWAKQYLGFIPTGKWNSFILCFILSWHLRASLLWNSLGTIPSSEDQIILYRSEDLKKITIDIPFAVLHYVPCGIDNLLHPIHQHWVREAAAGWIIISPFIYTCPNAPKFPGQTACWTALHCGVDQTGAFPFNSLLHSVYTSSLPPCGHWSCWYLGLLSKFEC